MYNKLRNFFNKASHIYILIAIILGIISITIIASYALDTRLTSSLDENTNNYVLNFNLGDTTSSSTKTITVTPGEVKLVDIVLTSEKDYNMKYSLYYTVNAGTESQNTILGVLNTSSCGSTGIISSSNSCTVTLVAVNKGDSSITYNVGTITGYENGGDLTPSTGKLITYTYSFPNKPNLQGNMIPVVYDETIGEWVKADSANIHSDYYWYEYSTKRWANAILPLSSMVVNLANTPDNTHRTSLTNGNMGGATINDRIASFDGTDDYLNSGLWSYNFGNSGSIVIRTKINSINSNTENALIGDWSYYKNGGWGLLVNSDGNLEFNIYNSSTSSYQSLIYDFSNLSLDTWYTIVGTYDGTNMKLYIDGIEVATSALNVDISTGFYMTIAANCHNSDDTLTYFYHSNIDVREALVFDRGLTATEIATDYSTDNINISNNADLLIHYDFSEGDDIPVGTIIGEEEIEQVGGFYTWIPRYKYRVWNIEKTAGTTQEETSAYYAYDALNEGIDIIFETATESTGTIKCNYNTALTPANIGQLSEVCIGANGDYYTHPSFTFGTEELTGIWMGKFETTLSSEITSPTVLPNSFPMASIKISEMHTKAIGLKSSSYYKISDTTLDSHMAKNIDWGAAAYLTHSNYGLCNNGTCSEIGVNNYLNSSSYLTGCGAANGTASSTTCNTYETETGQLASTTGNIYGIYDMSGGTNEYVMGAMYSNPTGTETQAAIGTSSSGFNGPNYLGTSSYTSGIDYPDSKYYDSYAYGEKRNASQSALNRGRLGDATAETISYVTTSASKSWNGDYAYFAGMYNTTSYGIFRRGGDATNGEYRGIFNYYASPGSSATYNSFRMVIT